MAKYPELAGYKTLEVPLDVIYFDRDFNCRGAFTPQSCVDLAASMRTKGLMEPIVIQPRKDIPSLSEEFEYRIIAGHRRFTAAKYLLKWKTIPATIRSGLSEEEAGILNIVENLERKDLTYYQEAVALRKQYPSGTPYEKMAYDLNRSSGWCKLRWKLLDMPQPIIEQVRLGIITQREINSILYKSEAELLAISAEVEAARLQGEKERRAVTLRLQNRSRNRQEIDTMLTHLMIEGRYPDPYQTLRWAAGHISDNELLESPDMEEYEET